MLRDLVEIVLSIVIVYTVYDLLHRLERYLERKYIKKTHDDSENRRSR